MMPKNILIRIEFSKPTNGYPPYKEIGTSLISILVPEPSRIEGKDRLCYQSVFMRDSADFFQPLDINGQPIGSPILVGETKSQGDQFCPKPLTESIVQVHYYESKSNRHALGVNSYYYPFDTINLETLIWVDAFYENDPETKIKIIPFLSGEVNTEREWEVDISNMNVDDENNKGAQVKITGLWQFYTE